MPITAKLNYFRMSPRKVRVVADAIRGVDVDEAEVRLAHLGKRATAPLQKLLQSAIANAEHNFQKDPAMLFVQTITVDGGPVLKRFRARAFGRAADIRRRTSHVTMVLGERKRAKSARRFTLLRERKPKEKEAGTLEELSERKQTKPSEFTAREMAKKSQGGFTRRVMDAGKRIFRRKSV